ncbi:hypothetical protein OSG_eHP12_00115 [environmental Halophage eHP-12]|nr:hypothetical protein OSG_eHP12_00115 [environmental Halophage eHP-12]
MTRYTLIQSGDFNAAENIGALAGDIQREGIVSGLGLSAFDASVPEIDVAAGKTVHLIDSQTAEATLDDGTTVSEQRDQVQLVSHVDPQTVGLTDNAINELYLTPQPAVDDSPNVIATTTGEPSVDALKIGEVDTATDTVSERWNLIRADGTLSYPDADAAGAVLQSLPAGVTVIDRSNDVRITDGNLNANGAVIGGIEIPDQISDTRNAVNQLFIDNARQDFELGLNIIDMDDGQFEIYANNNRIADSSNVSLNLGSPLNGKGTVSLASSATNGFTEHIIEDFDFRPNSVVVTDDLETNPQNGTVTYEIEDENANIVTVPRSQLNQRVDVSGTIETYAVSTRAVLERNSTTDTSPVLDAYSVYISGQKPDDYLDATVQTVSEV